MKKITLASLILTGVVATGAVGTLSASAETTTSTLTGKGTVEYVEDTSTNPVVDPENPDKVVTPDDKTTVNPNGGVITIDAVSNLDFGTQKIGVSPTEQVYKAAAQSLTLADETKVTRGNYVQWTDKRSGNDHTYQIKAALTQQFKNGTNELDGAKISYSNGMLNSVMPADNWPSATPQNFELTSDGGSVLVFDNSASKKAVGLGTYTAEFGQSNAEATNQRGDKSTGLAEDSVLLTVPAGLSITKGTYQADITWSIEYTPAPAAAAATE